MKGFHTNVVKRNYKMRIEIPVDGVGLFEDIITVEAESESAAILQVPENALFIEFVENKET